MSGQINDFEIIKLVELHPILYDKNRARGQKNAYIKDEAWMEISKRLNASERACITRWKSLRDRFGREYRRVREKPDETSTWDMFPHLTFLLDHYKHGQAIGDSLNIKLANKELESYNRNIGSQAEDDSNYEEETDPNELVANQELIAIVKDYPVLYDKQKIRDSKNLTAKHDAWIEISEGLGISEEICFKRWKKLRDRFAREYRCHQVYPLKPVTWMHFQDLMFLEHHYRKGVPLNVNNLKRKPKAVCTTENTWDNIYEFDCIEEDETMPESQKDNGEELQTQFDDIILMPESQQTPCTNHEDDDEPVDFVEKDAAIAESEEKLSTVVTNLQNVLRQSQDCLKTLQQQNQRHRQQLAEFTSSNGIGEQPELLQKVQILLKDLAADERQKAERKILQFLCECQIKTLNNEDVEDIKLNN